MSRRKLQSALPPLDAGMMGNVTEEYREGGIEAALAAARPDQSCGTCVHYRGCPLDPLYPSAVACKDWVLAEAPRQKGSRGEGQRP